MNQQQQQQRRPILFTYDVEWVEIRQGESNKNKQSAVKERWNVFINSSYSGSNDTLHLWIGILIGLLLNAIIFATLWTWIMRDLSYKPVVGIDYDDNNDDEEEEEEERPGVVTECIDKEVQLWPLSQHLFVRPTRGCSVLCIFMGIGAQLLLTGLFYTLFVQIGVINQTIGGEQITAALILYIVFSPLGGYVTSRFMTIFHFTRSDTYQSCIGTALLLPLVSFPVLHLVYDVLPSPEAPEAAVLSHLGPVLLIWVVVGWPLTAVGIWLGQRHGALNNFPVSEGIAGYHDLALQDNQQQHYAIEDDEDKSRLFSWISKCCRKCNILVMLLVGGLLPLSCAFIEYAYAVAAPVYVRYYADYRFVLAAFFLFTTCVAGVCALLFYRQIRLRQYRNWWWSIWTAGASAGLYIFVLSLSWLFYYLSQGDITGSTFWLYFLWFAWIGFGIALMTGFVGLAASIFLTRELYADTMRRNNTE